MAKRLIRMLATIMSLALALVLAACGGGDGGGSTTSSAPAKFTLEEQEIYHDDDVVVTVTGGSHSEDGYFIDLAVENIGSDYREVTFGRAALNGIYLPGWTEMAFVDAGDKMESHVVVTEEAASFAGIEAVDTIQFPISIHDGDYNFSVENETLDVEVASATGSNGFALTTSDEVVFDGDGLTVSYQGCGETYDGTFCAYFLVENDSNRTFQFNAYDAAVNGDTDADGVWVPTQYAPAGACDLLDVGYYNYDAENNDYETIDVTVGYYDAIRIPLHLTRSGDTVTVTADKAIYADGWGKDKDDSTSTSSSTANDGPLTGEDLKMLDTGVYCWESKSSFGAYSTRVFCVIENPNADLAVYTSEVNFTLYDEKGNEVATDKMSGITIEPDGIHPYVLGRTVNTDVPVSSVEASFGRFNFYEAGSGNYTTNNDDMSVKNASLNPGSHAGLGNYATFKGTLVNEGEAKDRADCVLALWDADNNMVFALSFDVKDVPEGGSVDFEEDLGIGLYDVPAYDSVTVDILTK